MDDEGAAVPDELFHELMLAGSLARFKAQHVIVPRKDGCRTLTFFDPDLYGSGDCCDWFEAPESDDSDSQGRENGPAPRSSGSWVSSQSASPASPSPGDREDPRPPHDDDDDGPAPAPSFEQPHLAPKSAAREIFFEQARKIEPEVPPPAAEQQRAQQAGGAALLFAQDLARRLQAVLDRQTAQEDAARGPASKAQDWARRCVSEPGPLSFKLPEGATLNAGPVAHGVSPGVPRRRCSYLGPLAARPGPGPLARENLREDPDNDYIFEGRADAPVSSDDAPKPKIVVSGHALSEPKIGGESVASTSASTAPYGGLAQNYDEDRSAEAPPQASRGLLARRDGGQGGDLSEELLTPKPQRFCAGFCKSCSKLTASMLHPRRPAAQPAPQD